jgi:hypothetical protein
MASFDISTFFAGSRTAGSSLTIKGEVAAQPVAGPPGTGPAVYLLLTDPNKLIRYNPLRNTITTVSKKIKGSPSGLTLSSDGRYGYVLTDAKEMYPYGATTVTEIDLATHRTLLTAKFSESLGAAASVNRSTLVFGGQNENNLIVVNSDLLTTRATIALPAPSQSVGSYGNGGINPITVLGNGDVAAAMAGVGGAPDHRVAVVNLTARTVLKVVSTAGQPRAVLGIPHSGNLYVLDFNNGQLRLVNGTLGAVIKTVQIPSNEGASAASSPNGTTLYVTSGSYLYAVSATTGLVDNRWSFTAPEFAYLTVTH